jgi:trehalose 6-phosphate phosphatase
MLEHALAAWDTVAGILMQSHILLLLEFDGTLAPVASSPGGAVLPPETRTVLKKLQAKDWCTVAVISGRSLRNLKGKVRIEGIIYAGDHGAEIEGSGIAFCAPVPPETLRALANIRAHLEFLPSALQGVLMEDKGTSLSIHFRAAKEAEKHQAIEAVRLASGSFSDTVKVGSGQEVVEVTPCSWDRGKAISWLVAHSAQPVSDNPIPVYIGDDSTDEDAFKAVGDRGLTVVVGRRLDSSARYYLNEPEEVCRFLEMILKLRVDQPPDWLFRKSR